MKEFHLNGKELTVLAVIQGGTEILGFPSMFSDTLSENAMENELRRIQSTLTEKGVLSAEDGTVVPEYSEMLNTLLHPVHYLAADGQRKGIQLPSHRIYIGSDKVYSAEFRGKDFQLKEIDSSQAEDLFRSYVDWSGITGTLPAMRAVLPEKKLANCGRRTTQEAMRTLVDAGLNGEGAALAISGLSHQADFYSFVFVDFADGTDAVRNLMFLADAGGALELSTDVADDLDQAVLESTTPEILAQKLDSAIRRTIAPAGGC